MMKFSTQTINPTPTYFTQTSVNSPFEASSYHEEHSIYKKYIMSGFSLSNFIDYESYPCGDTESSSEKDESKKSTKISGKKPMTKRMGDLMTLTEMEQRRDSYKPEKFPEDEIDRITSSLKEVEEKSTCGLAFLDSFYEIYQSKGGNLSKGEVQKKVISDLLFEIKKVSLSLNEGKDRE